MPEFCFYRKYINELLTLALPMIMGNLGVIFIGIGTVFVAARYSTDALAAISIGNSIISCVFMFGIGILASVSPILSNFRGSRAGAKKYFLPTIQFSTFLALLSTLIILACVPLVEKIGFEAKLIPVIKDYMIISAFSTFGAYLHLALKEFLQAFEIVFFPNLIAVFSVILNILLSFVLVFGWWGIPSMGVIGFGLVNVFVRTFEGLFLLMFALHFLKIKKYFNITYFQNLLKIGLPIAFALLVEFLAFNIITIIMGRVSSIYAASQNILLTFSTATIMVPIAISNAIAIKVGFANGAKNYTEAKRYALAGIGISVGFMLVCAFVYMLFPTFLVNIFTHDYTLVKICVPILFLLGVFQVFDGLQASLGGVLKGIKKTKIVMASSVIAYWLIGLPLGCWLAFRHQMALYGFWIGLAVALFAMSLILSLILLAKVKKIKSAA